MDRRAVFRDVAIGMFLLAALCVAIFLCGKDIGLQNSSRTMMAAYALLFVVYLARYRISVLYDSLTQRILAIVGVSILLLPIVYNCVQLLNPPYQLWIHKWLGDPIWIFAVPLASMVLFDSAGDQIVLRKYLARSALELVFAFPIWSWLWATIELLIGDSIVPPLTS